MCVCECARINEIHALKYLIFRKKYIDYTYTKKRKWIFENIFFIFWLVTPYVNTSLQLNFFRLIVVIIIVLNGNIIITTITVKGAALMLITVSTNLHVRCTAQHHIRSSASCVIKIIGCEAIFTVQSVRVYYVFCWRSIRNKSSTATVYVVITITILTICL